MDSEPYIFLLKDCGKIVYVFYDIKEALEKAIMLNHQLIRLRIIEGGEGRVSEMVIYRGVPNFGTPL
jgi:hypothetical protein